MTETSTERTGRAWIKYDPAEDVGEISLPGSIDAVPSILKAGDVFHVDASQADELTTDDDRFVEVDEPAKASPNEKLTREELADKLGDESLATEPKPVLVELADEYDRLTPIPPSASDPVVDDPDLLPYDAAIAAVDPDAGDDAGDDTKGASQ